MQKRLFARDGIWMSEKIMSWHITIYISTIFISIFVMAGLAVFSWHHSRVHGATTFACMNALGAWGALAEFLSMMSGTSAAAALWFNARFITLAGLPLAWFLFSLQYSGKDLKKRRWIIITLIIIPIVTQVMIWTNPFHGLWLEKDVGFYRVENFFIADITQRVSAPWFVVHSIYGYSLMFFGVVLVMNTAVRVLRLYRTQAATLAVGTIVLALGAAIPTFNILPHLRVNPVTQTLALSALIFAWAIFRHRFLDLVPVARDLLIDNIKDAMLVIDIRGRIVDINRSMMQLLSDASMVEGRILPEKLIGLPVMEILHPWKNFVERFNDEVNITAEVEVEIGGVTRSYELTLAPVANSTGMVQGKMIVLHDNTIRRRTDDMIQARLRLIEYSENHTLAELLEKTLDEVCEMTRSPIGFYHFVEPDQVTLSLQAWSSRTKKEYCTARGEGMHYSIDRAGVWVDCIHQKKPVIHNDYAALPNRKGLPEGHAMLVRELVVPIFREDKIVAILGIGNKAQIYNDDDVATVSYLADVAWEITRRKIAEESLREREKALRERNLRMERDLKIAQTAQKGIIQIAIPRCERISVDYRYKPMEKVGGDYFSLLTAKDGMLGVFIGDVSGHGLAAALFTSLLKSMTDRMFHEHWNRPSEYLENLNHEILDYMASYFFTGIYGLFEFDGTDKSVMLKYANGGHPHPIIMRAGRSAAYTGQCGNLMGIKDNLKFETNEEILFPGDRVFLYTDGIPETINKNNEMIGFEDSLLALFDAARCDSLPDTLDAVLDELNLFRESRPFQDDITLIGFEVV